MKRDKLNNFINEFSICPNFFKFVMKKDFENADDEDLNKFEEFLNNLQYSHAIKNFDFAIEVVESRFSEDELFDFYANNKKQIKEFFINEKHKSLYKCSAYSLTFFILNIEKLITFLARSLAVNFYFNRYTKNGNKKALRWKEALIKL